MSGPAVLFVIAAASDRKSPDQPAAATECLLLSAFQRRSRRAARIMCRFNLLRAGSFLGWENVVCSLPHRIAKAVKRTIHRMVRLPCLLTFSEGPLCGPVFHGGQPYTARPPLSLRDISPTLWGNLPAPPQSLRCPLRSAPCLCATGARRPFEKGWRKLYPCVPRGV